MDSLARERQKAAQADWYQNVVKARRAEWLAKNGPCRKCGSSENLEVDHIDRSQKVTHRIWTWAEDKRAAELAKCQVLCRVCHREKSVAENRQGNSPVGVNFRKKECVKGHPFDLFNTIVKANGHRMCRTCHNENRRRANALSSARKKSLKRPFGRSAA